MWLRVALGLCDCRLRALCAAALAFDEAAEALAGTAVCEFDDACVVEVEAMGSIGRTGRRLPGPPDDTRVRGGAE